MRIFSTILREETLNPGQKKTNPREINSVALKNVGFGLQPLKFASPVTLGELLKLWFLHFHIYLLGRTSSWTLPHGAAQSINELI